MQYDATRAALLHPHARETLFRPGQDWPIEAVCAECSRLAYVPFETGQQHRRALQQALGCAGLQEAEFFSDPRSGTQAFAALDRRAGRTLVVFRGTRPHDPSDISTDAQALLTAWQGHGKVHLGFRDALAGIWSQLESWLARSASAETWMTGHSLGAALATLAAALRPQARLVNFGSPRVGNAAFASQFDGRLARRYVNCCDLVTRLPPPLLGYAHIAGATYIDRHGQVQPEAAAELIARDMTVARRNYLIRESWRPGNIGVRDLADHSPINYVSGVLQDRT
jgi:triacylglycerol lipase